MTEGSGQPKRTRGRPRMPDSEKKRRNMTFRMRDDLRAAVERIADENGRSLSEQVEFFVEQCTSAYARRQYEFSHQAISSPIREFAAPSEEKSNQSDIQLPISSVNLEKNSSQKNSIVSAFNNLYNDLCERIENKAVEIENDNKRFRDELKRVFERMAEEAISKEKPDK